MADARWLDVDLEIADAVSHFDKAVRLHALGGFDAEGLMGYQASMALMAARGYTAFDPPRAGPAIELAGRLAAGLAGAVAAFKLAIDGPDSAPT